MTKTKTSFIAAVSFMACASPAVTLDPGTNTDVPDSGVHGGFAIPDESSSDADTVDSAAPRALCIATGCPGPFATCPGSLLCSIDLSTDDENCGACGHQCPSVNDYPGFNMSFECIDGECRAGCHSGYADCDGVLDNGCEASLSDRRNCGACGNDCGDDPCKEGRCETGCPPETPDFCDPDCVNLQTDILNCGECGNICVFETCEGPSAMVHVGLGCGRGQCGIGCEPKWLDCDSDLPLGCSRSNGCETPMDVTNNCGACGRRCPPGQECVESRSEFSCQVSKTLDCPPGLTRCSTPKGDICVDVQSDTNHCGGCSFECAALEALSANTAPHCRMGLCVTECQPGWANCDDNPRDCETNVLRDPINCGACGVMCEYAQGQPCVGGQCWMKECDDEEIPR